MLRVHRRQAVLVDQHGLVREPRRPRRLADVRVDALAEFARPWGEVQAFGLALFVFAEHLPRHVRPSSSFLTGAGMPSEASSARAIQRRGIIVAHAVAQRDLAPFQRLHRKAVVGEAVVDRRQRARGVVIAGDVGLEPVPRRGVVPGFGQRPQPGPDAGLRAALQKHRSRASRSTNTSAWRSGSGFTGLGVGSSRTRSSRSATHSPCSGHSTQAGSARVHKVAPKSICAWV